MNEEYNILLKNGTWKGFGFKHIRMITDEKELVKGITLFLFGKSVINLVVSNTEWKDENGIAYGIKKDGRVFFFKKLAIGILD